MALLEIRDLHAQVGGPPEILKGTIDLTVDGAGARRHRGRTAQEKVRLAGAGGHLVQFVPASTCSASVLKAWPMTQRTDCRSMLRDFDNAPFGRANL